MTSSSTWSSSRGLHLLLLLLFPLLLLLLLLLNGGIYYPPSFLSSRWLCKIGGCHKIPKNVKEAEIFRSKRPTIKCHSIPTRRWRPSNAISFISIEFDSIIQAKISPTTWRGSKATPPASTIQCLDHEKRPPSEKESQKKKKNPLISCKRQRPVLSNIRSKISISLLIFYGRGFELFKQLVLCNSPPPPMCHIRHWHHKD